MSPEPGRPSAAIGLLTVALAAILLIGLGLGLSQSTPPGPQVAAQQPDLPPLALDGEIDDASLVHDSRDDTYRTPFGAVPAGTEVTLRLRAAAGDLEEATVRIWDALAESQVLIPMSIAARDATAGDHGYDYWQVTLPTLDTPAVLYYRFIVRDGAVVRYLEDDALLDGGAGQVYADSPDLSWQIDTYDPAFATPDWAKGAVVYQIFPDRFANGDPTNDPAPEAVPGSAGAERYRSGDVYGNPIAALDWEADLPEGYCRAYQAPSTPCTDQPLGRDFYGGDLAGITDHLAEIADLGVTAIYLNPIFAAPSNHRYDTSDYTVIDPDLGTLDDFHELLAAAESNGIHVILDGVFNHTSSDAPTFDRNHRFDEVGACESADSPWATWYVLTPGPPEKCFDGQSYTDWFGFDTLAVLSEHPDVLESFYGDDGIVRRWLGEGIHGWRLDVMNEISHATLSTLRDAAKAEDPDALVLGEDWGDASTWLLGTEADSVMNYRFRRAVIGLVNGDTPDLDGAIAGLTPSEFASTMDGVREDYPPAAWAVLHNLVDSHDTTRILWTLTPGADNREAKEDAAALDIGKARLRLIAALQLTWPGMAGIYYGDEVGLTGHDDPDDRRPYPWGAEDTELRDAYRSLAQLRAAHEALRTGDLTFLLADDEAATLAYGRRTDDEAAITVLNLGDAPRTVEVELEGWVPAATAFVSAIGPEATIDGGVVRVDLPAFGSAVLLTAAGTDLAAPAAPESVQASAEAGAVTVTWTRVDDAEAYTVWRSLLSGGGYTPAGSASGDQTTFTDSGVRNGTTYHYVVTAEDASRNVGPRSSEATALPRVVVADARLSGPPRTEQELSAVAEGAPIEARVRVDGVSVADGPTIGVLVELGFGPEGAEPLADEWSWSPMQYAGETAGSDVWTGIARPESAASWALALRVSTDGGATWQLAGIDGLGDPPLMAELVTVAGSDAAPPPVPVGLVATSISPDAIALAWQPVDAEDLYRYEIYRADASDPDALERVGIATDATFQDQDVRSGGTYRYVVAAADTSFNRSQPSEAIEVGAESRQVAVTFTVSVPATTPADGTVYIAGDFQGWDPAATPMERVDATTWSITLPFAEGTPLQYKYVRQTWDAVEKDDGCGEIPNRELTVQFGTEATMAVEDTVAKWRDVDACG